MRPPFELSNSRMKTLNCARYFQLRYILGEGDTDSIPALIGRLGHEAAQQYIAHLARVNRRSDMDRLVEISLALVEGLPEHIETPVLKACEMFMYGFKLDKKAQHHYTELALAVDCDYHPFDPERDDDGKVINLDRDCVTGRIDCVAVYKDGKRAEIWDFKMGEEHVKQGSAKRHMQLQLYAALWFLHHPECEIVDVVLWGVKYGSRNRDSHRYTREACIPEAEERCELGFAKLDALWDLLGPDVDWPAQPDVTVTCKYCSVCERCPKNLALVAEVLSCEIVSNRKRKIA